MRYRRTATLIMVLVGALVFYKYCYQTERGAMEIICDAPFHVEVTNTEDYQGRMARWIKKRLINDEMIHFFNYLLKIDSPDRVSELQNRSADNDIPFCAYASLYNLSLDCEGNLSGEMCDQLNEIKNKIVQRIVNQLRSKKAEAIDRALSSVYWYGTNTDPDSPLLDQILPEVVNVTKLKSKKFMELGSSAIAKLKHLGHKGYAAMLDIATSAYWEDVRDNAKETVRKYCAESREFCINVIDKNESYSHVQVAAQGLYRNQPNEMEMCDWYYRKLVSADKRNHNFIPYKKLCDIRAAPASRPKCMAIALMEECHNDQIICSLSMTQQDDLMLRYAGIISLRKKAEALRTLLQDVVLRALKDKEPAVRWAAARTFDFWNTKNKAVIDGLVGLLFDPEKQVREEAISALRGTGLPDKSTLNVLMKVLATDKEPEVRGMAFSMICDKGKNKWYKRRALKMALRDKSRSVRDRALLIIEEDKMP